MGFNVGRLDLGQHLLDGSWHHQRRLCPGRAAEEGGDKNDYWKGGLHWLGLNEWY
ncbi:MAG: hypothetical protein NVSMB30_08590 [Hymenobacter sp.]